MKFCPKCKGILIPKKVNEKDHLGCMKCSYTESSKTAVKLSSSHLVEEERKNSDVIKEGSNLELLPKTDVICPKCRNKLAYYWTVQMRASDEPETKFLKCTKCKYTWRDYK